MSFSSPITLVNIVAAGSKGQNGRVNGGIYFPGFTKPGGQIVQARWEGNFFINTFGNKKNADGTDMIDHATQQPVPRDNKVVRLTAWNGRNAQPGKGLADLMARCISPGKSLSAACELNPYEANVRDRVTGVVMQYSDGSPVTTPRMGFTVIGGKFEFGNDSSKAEITEVQSFDPANPNMDIFFRRPPQWDQAGTPGQQLWEQIKALRSTQVYTPGNAEYGFARVANVQGNAQQPIAQQPITQPVAQPLTNQVTTAVNNQVPMFDPYTGQPVNATLPAATAPPAINPATVQQPVVQQGAVVPQQF